MGLAAPPLSLYVRGLICLQYEFENVVKLSVIFLFLKNTVILLWRTVNFICTYFKLLSI